METRISAVEYAKLKKVSPMAVSKWIASGKLGPMGDAVIRNGRRYLIDSLKADQYLDINVKMTNQRIFNFENNAPSNTPSEMPENKPHTDRYREATTWKAQYEALLRQQEYEIKSGKYILADEAYTIFFNKIRGFRDVILNIPPRIGRIVAAEIYKAVLADIADIITEAPESLLDKIQLHAISHTEAIMKSELEQALKELAQ